MAEQLHALLGAFKPRMRVFHDMEDYNLSFMLKSSEEALNSLLGVDMMSSDAGKELIMERARYVYNDSLDLFYDNFKNEIARMALTTYKEEDSEG
ncbi:phage gp6-like head-tail connector protein [Streptococcus chenjunshii]|uniref:Phage gp6-like head-tail connector protein n=1 Tax=Streptococcus chenjunshii TaxID=2173853 RepID=A0A372KLR8_9STRE|nr:phage gp6-like head-tail connector protein [Streptococcus chenjunshii]AXQ79428.1 phage gp6-like head-tail connector protein [Streptococcus chenjunshii]RFU51115.1 phage gp6-like head-tail connector protein [Streptococcus chenjunshii]RFU53213.1 phage gp6-like head-tail connector protein [Streptococcus chenjunshii]